MTTLNARNRTLKTRPCQHRLGAAVVELAIVLPVFVAILLGTIETCKMIFLQQSLEIAAYEAARVAIVPATDSSDVNAAANALLIARRVNGAVIAIIPSDFQSAPYGSFIRVNVSASCNSNASSPLSFYGSKTLTGTVEMMKEF
jgi:Flp pilus assembly protein TadG